MDESGYVPIKLYYKMGGRPSLVWQPQLANPWDRQPMEGIFHFSGRLHKNFAPTLASRRKKLQWVKKRRKKFTFHHTPFLESWILYNVPHLNNEFIFGNNYSYVAIRFPKHLFLSSGHEGITSLFLLLGHCKNKIKH